MERYVIATNNAHKLREIRAILENDSRAFLSMEEAHIHTDPEETGATFEENALIKARAACAASGLPAMADDSGICVDALGGAPGIHSARYCPGTDRERTEFLLKNMEAVPDGQRQGRFVSVIACVYPDGMEFTVRGECEGVILREIRGEGGFGYDPIFFSPGDGCTFAEMPQARKNEISHRARALAAMKAALEARGR
ncbi:MAG: RdgB/HAM1 family non-canonical purine NTP pyrophosphatase [Clostridia bacterium]|nr:RdgB/HAM1 family non-canonical purine NTP pyrophosphatase [Clostridia bacterium]